MNRIIRHGLAIALTGAAIAILVGCSNPPSPTTTPTAPGEHGHRPGAHNGTIVEIGSDSYHAEAVFEKGGQLRLYMLGKDEAVVHEVEAQPLTAYVKVEGATEAEPFMLRPESQAGDRTGMTSLFVGQLPRDAIGKRLDVTIPSIRIGGERFRFGFKNTADDSHGDAGMPTKAAAAQEKTLYLTPGGKYTAADIKANGSVTASQKFEGLKAEHDLKPKPGDKICPITLTKANAKFGWVVGGKTYEFCCPPCVDEFVATAKEKPDEIKEPDEYRKK